MNMNHTYDLSLVIHHNELVNLMFANHTHRCKRRLIFMNDLRIRSHKLGSRHL